MPGIIISGIVTRDIIGIPIMLRILHSRITEQEIGMLDISGLPNLTAGSCVIISKIRMIPSAVQLHIIPYMVH